MTAILTAYEEKLTTVPRWGIVRTIQKQSVADHSFLVAVMAPRIAIKYFGWNPERDFLSLWEVQRYALLHDQHESFSGDIPSPMKNADGFNKDKIEASFGPWINETVHLSNGAVKTVVKIADYLESIRFIQTEIWMGNASCQLLLDHLTGKFMTFCNDWGIPHKDAEDMLGELSWNLQDPLDHPPIPKADDAN